MKLIGLMSWYDEDASWLTAAISSHYRAGLTHLVAVDGAYELYPDGRARSGVEQHRAISETCEGLGISSTIYAPTHRWAGDEVEKRSFMFKLGLAVADGPQDWFVIIDADHLMTDPDDMPKLLAETDLHAADLMAWQRINTTVPEARQFKMPPASQSKIRLAYRANPGLRCVDNHYTYVDGEGRRLWGTRDCVEALDLGHIKVEHRTAERALQRHEDQREMYRRREATGIERGHVVTCDWVGCHEPPATKVLCEFSLVEGTFALSANGMSVCKKHAKRAHYQNKMTIKAINERLGLDFDYGREGELLKRHT